MTVRDGEGSSFIVYIPEELEESSEEVVEEIEKVEKLEIKKEKLKIETEKKKLFKEFVKDDRDSIEDGGKTLLIIEDDPNFIKIIFDLARDKGFKMSCCRRWRKWVGNGPGIYPECDNLGC